MTAVFVVRHPQTTWNVAERYQGRLDAPPSAEGWKQIALTADAFRAEALDAVYSSPMARALDLAHAIAKAARAPLVIDHRLTEIAMGPWEGLYRVEIQQRFPHLFEEWYRRPDLVTFPNGETLEQVTVRAESALADVFERHPDRRVCIVTHSAVVQVLAAAALGLDLRYVHRIHVANAGISTFSGNVAPGALLSLNVMTHLQEEPAGLTVDATRQGRKAS